MTLFYSLRFRPFALLWSGQTISRLGDSLYRVALAWWVLEKTGSAAAMGTVLMFSFTPMVLFLLVGGVVVDRLPRLRVLMASDLFSGVIISSVALLAYTDRLLLWHVYVASLLFGFVEAFFFPAYNAVVPDLIPADGRPSANSLTSLSRDIAGVAGPALGALIVAVGGTPLAFALNGLSFFAASLCVLPVLGHPTAGSATQRGRAALGDLQDGLRTVAGSPWLWITILVFGLINITAASPASVALPFLIKQNLHADVEVLGLFNSLFSAGSLLAAVLLGRLTRIPHRGLLAYGATVVNGLLTLSYGLVPLVPVLAGAALLRGATVTAFGLIWINTLQELVRAAADRLCRRGPAHRPAGRARGVSAGRGPHRPAGVAGAGAPGGEAAGVMAVTVTIRVERAIVLEDPVVGWRAAPVWKRIDAYSVQTSAVAAAILAAGRLAVGVRAADNGGQPGHSAHHPRRHRRWAAGRQRRHPGARRASDRGRGPGALAVQFRQALHR
jgi:hypothetical protein